MSVIATAVRHLMAAGVTGEALLAAIAELEEQVRAEPKPRSAGAIRQERYRRNKASQVTECDAGDAQPALSRPLPSPQTPLPTPTHTHPEKQTPARKGHRLPVDWMPAPLTGDAADAVAGWPPGAEERELARFRDWAASATGPNALKTNWDAAWRNWIRKAVDDGRYGKSHGRNSQSARPAIIEIGRSVAADLEREARSRAGF